MRKGDLGSSAMSYPIFSGFGTSESHQGLHRRSGSIAGSMAAPVGAALAGRMQRLQELISKLNEELAERGEASPYVSELRGRIAELTRENLKSSLRLGTVPPPYQS